MSNILGNMPPVFGSGYRGVVPAPSAADVSAQNILRADGTWGAGPSGTLPSQTGNGGKLLTTDGTNASWASSLNTFQFGDVTLGTSGPSVKSTLSARAPRQGLIFDGTNKATVSVPAFGTSDFTLDAVANTDNAALPNYIVSGATGCFSALSLGGGELYFFKGAGNARTINGVFTSKKTVRITISKESGVIKTYVNGVLVDTWTDTNDATGGYTQPITGIGGISTQYWSGYLAVNIYNRALSASEVVSLYEAGAPSGADYNNASSTSTVTGDSSTFTSGVGSWLAWGAGTITASAGVGNVTSGATTDNGDYLAAQLPLSPAAFTNLNKRYRITLTLGSVTGGTVIVRNLVGSGTRYATGLTSGTHIIDTGLITGQQNFGLAASAAGVTFTVDNITVVPLGLLLAPDAAQAGGGLTWYDTSGNAANITLPASGVSWNVPSSRVLGGAWTVQGNLSVNANQVLQTATSDTIYAYNQIRTSLSTGGGLFGVEGNAAGSLISGTNAYATVVSSTSSGTDLQFGTSGFVRATIGKTTGNFLIGTTIDGGQKLQVNGDATFAGTVTASGNISSNAVFGSSSGTLYLRPNGISVASGQATIDTSGNATFAGSIRQNQANNISLTSGVATTIFSLGTSAGVYIVTATLDVNGVAGYAIVGKGATGTWQVLANSGTQMSFSMSTNDLQITQSSGATSTTNTFNLLRLR